MANWYYYNKNDEKIGPISAAVLKELASQGLITKETKVENSNGRTALAGQVNGLTFAETKKPEAPPPVEAEVYGLTSPSSAPPTAEFDFPALTSEAHTPSDFDPFATPAPVAPQAPPATSKLPAALKKPIVAIPVGCFAIFLFLIVLGIIGAIIDPEGMERRKEAREPRGSQVSDTTIDLSAGALMSAYNANKVSADRDFKGKILQVSGTIDTIGKDALNSPYVALKTKNPIFSVQCIFSKRDEAALTSLRKGASITIKGKCSGATGNVILRNCSIVEP